MTGQDIVLCETDGGGVARVTLNRPDVRNAMNDAFIARLIEVFEALAADEAVRCVVVTGAGKAFCAGGDLNWMRKTADYGRHENYADANTLGAMLRAFNELPKPTIGLVNGAAFGGGVGMVACCDIAVASDQAKFSLSEVRLGLLPATISPYVVRKMGQANARRYFLTGEVFDGDVARAIGLVHEVVPAAALEDAGRKFVELLMLGGPAAQAASKELVFRVSDRPIDEVLIDWTARRIAEVRASDEGKEGAAAFLEKRKPRWQSE